MPTARRPFLLLLFLLSASASDDLWAACLTETSFLYDYVIADKGCKLSCLYLTASDSQHFDYFDALTVSNHSLEETQVCQHAKYPATGDLCITVAAVKFGDYQIPKRFPAVKFVMEVGNQTFISDDKARTPVMSDGRVSFHAQHCFPNKVAIDEPIALQAIPSGLPVPYGGRVSLLDARSNKMTARRVLRDGNNGTLFSTGVITDTLLDLIISFTGREAEEGSLS